MFPYILLTSGLCFLTLFDKTKYQRTFFIFVSLIMILFSGLRIGGTGLGDYDAYLRLYSLVETFDEVINPKIHAEIGFRLLSFVGNDLGFEGQFAIFWMALIAFSLVAQIIYKESPYPLFSLLILLPFFFSFNMQTSRASVAAGFGLYFIFKFLKGNYKTALLFFILAISFHYSALVLVLVLLVKVPFLILFFMSTFGAVFVKILDPFSILIKISNLIGMNRISDFILIYVNSPDYGYPMKIYDPRILLGLGVMFLIFRARKKLASIYDIRLFKIYVIGLMILLCFSNNTAIALRTSYYFLLVSVVAIPIMAEAYNKSDYRATGIKRTNSLSFILVYCLYSFALIGDFQPYKFVF